METTRNLLIQCKVDAKTAEAANSYQTLAKSADKADASIKNVNKSATGKIGSLAKGVGGQVGERAGGFGMQELGLAGAAGKAGPAGIIAGLVLGAITIGVNLAVGRKKELDKKIDELAAFFAYAAVEATTRAQTAFEQNATRKQTRNQNLQENTNLAEAQRRAMMDIEEREAQIKDERDFARRGGAPGLEKDSAMLQSQESRINAERAATEREIVELQARNTEETKDREPLRIAELALLKRQREELDRAAELANKMVEVKQKQLDAAMKVLEVEKATAEESLNKAKQALEIKKQGVQTAKEEFGLADKADKREILRIAGKLEKGGTLNKGEIEFAKGRGSIFGDALRQQGTTIADQSGFQQLVRNTVLGLNTRTQDDAVRAAENFKVEIQRKIDIQLVVNNQELVKELVKQLGPLYALAKENANRTGQLTREQLEAKQAQGTLAK